MSAPAASVSTLRNPQTLLSATGAWPDSVTGFGPAGPAPVPGAISLVGGAPGAEALPLTELRHAAESLIADNAVLTASLQYSAAAGIPQLRAWIARHEDTVDAQVIVTNGAFHSLSLVFDALLEDGDTVLVENPTYPLVFRALQYKKLNYAAVDVTDFGLDIDGLAARLAAGLRPKAYYSIPDFQNPTGVTVPAAQRERLVGLAERYGFVIISDSPYRELRYSGGAEADFSLASELVVHVNTFSKTLGPGLRLGWIAAPLWLVPALLRLRQNQDQHSSNFGQNLVTGMVAEPGVFAAIVSRASRLYGERANYLASRLKREVDGGVAIPHLHGGIFLWAQVLDPSVDVLKAQSVARTLGTDFTPGRFFFSPARDHDGGFIRFGISHLSLADLATATDRAISALNDAAARR